MIDACIERFGRWGFGIVLIVAVAAIWAGSSVLTQFIYSDLDFRSPFFITYFATTLFSMYIPMWFASVRMGRHKDLPWSRDEVDDVYQEGSDLSARSSTGALIAMQHSTAADNTTAGVSSSSGRSGGISTEFSYNPISSHDEPGHGKGHAANAIAGVADHAHNSSEGHVVRPRLIPVEERYTHKEIIRIAAIVSPLWFGANCLYNYSLLETSVGSSTIISNLSGTFTLMFSLYFGLESLSWPKVAGMLCAFGGVVLIGLQDSSGGEGDDDGQPRSLFGDVVAIFAAVLYGLYTSVLRYQSPSEDDFPMQLVLGYLGLINGIALLPAVIIMVIYDWGNVDEVTWVIFGFLLLSGFFNNVVSDLLWAKSIVLTSPTVATVGLSITIPLAMLSDFLIFGAVPTGMAFGGATLVLLGFVCVAYRPAEDTGNGGGTSSGCNSSSSESGGERAPTTLYSSGYHTEGGDIMNNQVSSG